MSTATAAAPVRKTRTKAAEHVGTAQETEEGEPAAAQAAPKFTPALDAFEKIEKAKTEWKKSFLERGTELDLVLVGLIARQNVLFVGPPGTAKSAICDAIHELTGGEHFTCLLNKFTAPEELFGPPNLKMLEQGEYVRNVDGFLPTAKTAFLDEIFKAGPGILNTMLKILNEGTFKNGKQVRSCPLEFALAASNEWPGGDNAGELSALFDRFTIRKTVSTVKQAANRAKLLFGDLAHDPFDALTPAELEAARVDAAGLQFNKDAADTMKTIIRELSQQGINPGDRRLRKSVSVAKAWAWLEGAKEVEPVHLEVLQYVLWEDPAEHTRKASEIVMKNCNPGGAVVAEKILLADQLIAKANLNDLGDLVTKQKELQSIIRDLGKVPGDAAKEAIRRIEAEKAKLMKAALEATS